jgi:hypothetical protein
MYDKSYQHQIALHLLRSFLKPFICQLQIIGFKTKSAILFSSACYSTKPVYGTLQEDSRHNL